MKRVLSGLLCAALAAPSPAAAFAAARPVEAAPRVEILPPALPAAVVAPPPAQAADAATAPAPAETAGAALTRFGAEASSAQAEPQAAQALPFAGFDGGRAAEAPAVPAAPSAGPRRLAAALVGAAVLAHADAASAIVVHPQVHAASHSLSASDKLGFVVIAGAIIGLMFLTRWLSGSDRVQVYLERQKWKTQTGRKWSQADEETRALVENNGKATAAANRAGRVNSWPELKAHFAGMGAAVMFWRWPRYFKEMRAAAGDAPGPRRVDEETGEEGPYARRETAQKRSKDLFASLRERIEKAGMTDEARETALDELAKLEQTPKQHPEYGNRLAYLEWLLALPWQARTPDHIDLAEARRIIDEDHFGLEEVKRRVLEYLAVRKRTGTLRGPILCFVGPPGVGKTSIARDIARTLGRKFVRLSLGGVEDESEIRGHRRTYLGAEPGAIIARMKRAGTKNPVFLLDEVDKTATNKNGRGSGPQNALLELLDPEQNDTFRDRYLDVGFDMSEVLFIVTANDINGIPEPLRDRVEIIQYKSYTTPEKVEIAKRHVIPEKQAANGLGDAKIEVAEEAVKAVIEGYTQEAGVRQLRQKIEALMRGVAARAEIDGEPVPSRIGEADVEKYLGVPPVRLGRTVDNSVGVASGLYYSPTGSGGITNTIVNVYPGSGVVADREQMGKQMRDSVDNVLAYVRQYAAKLGVDPFLFKKIDVSVSFAPWNEIDGPSAGVTMTAALVSRLTGRAVKPGVAMTGELSPDGRVLPIGGLNEKVLGALRLGYATVLYPAENARDAALIDEAVKKRIRLVPVETVGQLLDEALEKQVSEPLPDMTPPVAPAAR